MGISTGVDVSIVKADRLRYLVLNPVLNEITTNAKKVASYDDLSLIYNILMPTEVGRIFLNTLFSNQIGEHSSDCALKLGVAILNLYTHNADKGACFILRDFLQSMGSSADGFYPFHGVRNEEALSSVDLHFCVRIRRNDARIDFCNGNTEAFQQKLLKQYVELAPDINGLLPKGFDYGQAINWFGSIFFSSDKKQESGPTYEESTVKKNR